MCLLNSRNQEGEYSNSIHLLENMALYVDVSRTKVMLGGEPRVLLDAGLRWTIQWIRNAS